MIGQNQRLQIGGGFDLIVGADGEGLAGSVEASLGGVGVGLIDGGAYCLKTDALGIQCGRIELHPNGGLLIPLDRDKADPGNFAQFLGQNRVGKVIHPYQGECVRSDGEGQDGGIRRIHLTVNRRIRHGGRQDTSGCIDRRLHILRCLIDVFSENKLECDDGGALGTDGVHRGEAADLSELFFQRGCDERGHHLGIGPRILRGYLDCRKINGGERRYGQESVTEHPHQNDGKHQQGCCNRPFDEWLGSVHEIRVPIPPGGGLWTLSSCSFVDALQRPWVESWRRASPVGAGIAHR